MGFDLMGLGCLQAVGHVLQEEKEGKMKERELNLH